MALKKRAVVSPAAGAVSLPSLMAELPGTRRLEEVPLDKLSPAPAALEADVFHPVPEGGPDGRDICIHPAVYVQHHSFLMWAPADFSISFFLPTLSKATSTRASPPMGRTESTMPFPKAVCSTMSPW